MKTFIVAELSANHGNDIEIVKKSLIKAKNIGCDAMKIQTFKPEYITLDCEEDYFKINNNTIWDGNTLYNLYKSTYLPWEWHDELYDFANKIGMILFSSPFDEKAVELLERNNNPIYKIASFEITDTNLIEKVAKCGKPVFISTGIASENEIEEAVDVCRKAGNNDITLLQCTSDYPAKHEDANLATMVDMKKRYGVKVGVSDHSIDNVIATTAVAMGASVVEKHFTLDKTIGGADASFSLDAIEFEKLVYDIRTVEKCIGTVSYELTEKKIRNRKFSRSLFVIKNVKAGDIISDENVRSIRPGDGISPKYLHKIMGKKFLLDVKKGTPLTFDFFEGDDNI